MTRRAARKRMRKKFRVGDVVTWGHGFIAHRVIAVHPSGVVVDTTSTGIGRSDDEGRRVMLIEFAPGSRSQCRYPGPPRHSDLEPDRSLEFGLSASRSRRLIPRRGGRAL